MSTVMKNEFELMFSNARLNRLRYFAYSSFFCIFLILIGALTTVILKSRMVESKLLFKLLIIAFLISYFVPHLWLIKRRINDTGRSLMSYIKVIVLAQLLILWPTVIISLLPSLKSAQPIGDIIKVITALDYIVGIGVLIYAYSMVFFFRGAACINKYGATPPANNYFIITFSVIYFVMQVAIFEIVFTQGNKAIANARQHKLTESIEAMPMADLQVPSTHAADFSPDGIPSDLNVNLK